MKMFSDCSGECCVCAVGNHCVAGHGDDEYFPADVDTVINRLLNNEYPSYRREMLEYIGMTEEDFEAYIAKPTDTSDLKNKESDDEPLKFPYRPEPFAKVPVTITKTVFNSKYWIVGDLYYISIKVEQDPSMYFLHSKSDDAVTLVKADGALRKAKLSCFLEGEYTALAHITQEELYEYVSKLY